MIAVTQAREAIAPYETGQSLLPAQANVSGLKKLPSRWGLKKLKFVASIRMSNIDKHSVDGEEAIRLCNYVDVYRNQKIVETIAFMEATASKEQVDRFALRRDDVLITKDSETPDDIGVPSLVAEDLAGVVCGYHLALLRCDPRICIGPYLVWVLRSSFANTYFGVEANGITRFAIGNQTIGDFALPLPPIAEQKAIAKYLEAETGRIDVLILKKKELADLLKKERDLLIGQLCRGANEKEPGSRKIDAGWIESIPGRWSVKRNRFLFREIDDRGFDDLPILEVSIHSGVTVRAFSAERVEQRSDDLAVYKRALAGDIVFNKMRMWQGAVGVALVDGLVSPDYTVARPRDGLVSQYFGEQFRLPEYCAEVYRYSRGIHDDRNRLYWDGFASIHSLLPSVHEQQKIVARISEIRMEFDRFIGLVNSGIEALLKYRLALISSAVLGGLARVG